MHQTAYKIALLQQTEFSDRLSVGIKGWGGGPQSGLVENSDLA